MLILSFMSVERFILIAAPLKGHRAMTFQAASSSMIVIWIIGFILALMPGLFLYEDNLFDLLFIQYNFLIYCLFNIIWYFLCTYIEFSSLFQVRYVCVCNCTVWRNLKIFSRKNSRIFFSVIIDSDGLIIFSESESYPLEKQHEILRCQWNVLSSTHRRSISNRLGILGLYLPGT